MREPSPDCGVMRSEAHLRFGRRASCELDTNHDTSHFSRGWSETQRLSGTASRAQFEPNRSDRMVLLVTEGPKIPPPPSFYFLHTSLRRGERRR